MSYFEIIENTDKEKDKYNEEFYGGQEYKITTEDIKALYEGKCLASEINQEYTIFIIMENRLKIKWIDILNRIANKGKVPHKIKYNLMQEDFRILIYDEEEQEYRYENDWDVFAEIPNHHLNDEVEILEF